MLLDRLELTPSELEERTGWALKPEGLCRDDRCVPLRRCAEPTAAIDVRAVAERCGCRSSTTSSHGLWALGPEAGGHVLESAELPPIVLPDVEGRPFDLASLRGQKVVIAAWASW